MTKGQMIAAKLHEVNRDYCADTLIDFKACRHEHFPFVQWHCSHAKHAYIECQKEDWYHRMREYERERRLRKRQERVDKKTARLARAEAAE